jgi:predicted DNA-binding antitoxin AbrB/MazE fold protein
MTKTLEATYDGEVLRPDEPLELEPNTRVQITIETQQDRSSNGTSFLKTARSLNLEGPPDWSDRLEEYLYGPKSDANR